MPDLSHPAAAFGLGVALGTSPGPVQLLLFSESSRRGVGRGLRVMAGANFTFGMMLVLLAFGLSSIEPGDTFLRAVKVVGGGFLVWLAVEAFRESRRSASGRAPGSALDPALRGVLAVLLNPGVYVFLATTGAAMVAAAAHDGGRGLALLTVLALLLGVTAIDTTMVLLGGGGAARVGDRALRMISAVLALVMAGLGVVLIAQGIL